MRFTTIRGSEITVEGSYLTMKTWHGGGEVKKCDLSGLKIDTLHAGINQSGEYFAEVCFLNSILVISLGRYKTPFEVGAMVACILCACGETS